MSISDERLAKRINNLEFDLTKNLTAHEREMREEGLALLRELQSLRAAAKVRAIREGDGEAEPVDPNSWEGAFARLTGADNLEAGAGDLVERGLGDMSRPDLYAEVMELRKSLLEAAAQLAAVTAENALLREAEARVSRLEYVLLEIIGTVDEYQAMPCDSLERRMFNTVLRYRSEMEASK